MERNFKGAQERLLAKPVLKSRLINDFTTAEGFTLSREDAKATVSSEQTFEGKPTTKLEYPATFKKPKIYLTTRVRLSFDEENWSDYNRISVWIYPVKNGFDITRFVSVELIGKNNMMFHEVILKANEWNHIIWEIPDRPRENIIALQINFSFPGQQANMEDTSFAYLSKLELQKVEADKFMGWETEGKIALCHSGYSPDSQKVATVSLPEAKEFSVCDAKSGKAVYNGKAKKIKTLAGSYYTLDFTDLKVEGKYFIECAGVISYPFEIRKGNWLPVADKIRNFFFEERCGCEVEGLHLPCHLDCFSVHPDGRKLSVGGGWHDAADLSQGLCNTAEAATAFMDMASKIRKSDPELYKAMLDEARQGIEWALNTRFDDGYRTQWISCNHFTKGIVGDEDDVTDIATNRPFETLCAVVAEAKAAVAFKDHDELFAEKNLKAAKEDFVFATELLEGGNDDGLNITVVEPQLFGQAAYAACVLYETTGDETYLGNAVEYTKRVMACQQRELPDWDTPIRGFFYEDSTCKLPVAYDHRGHEQAMVIGTALLLKLLPQHADAPLWKQSLELYREYILGISALAEPYGILPAAVHFYDTPISITGGGNHNKVFCDKTVYENHLKTAIRLGEGVYLRRQPIGLRFNGSFGVQMAKAKAVSVVGTALNDTELLNIAEKQLSWVLGNNPFARSYMYGEGYDYPDMYACLHHNIVGQVPVGIKNWGSEDIPFMPQTSCATFMEIWVHPASRMLWVMADIHK